MTLLQLIAKKTALGKRYAQRVLEKGEVMRNGVTHFEGSTLVGKFDHITAAGKILCALTPRYVILHKPSGILSATSDPIHRTVIDLISEKWAGELHLAGRLDRATTGLVILTNDSAFSKSLTHPDEKVPKTYRVTTDQAITEDVKKAFVQGMYFAKENIFTHPAKIDLLHSHSCRLTIFEGKHHQIKRMFLQFGIRVTQLHRESIGKYALHDDLNVGEYRSFLP